MRKILTPILITLSTAANAQVRGVVWPGSGYGFKAQLVADATLSPQGVITKCFYLTNISINTEQTLLASYTNDQTNSTVLKLALENTFNAPNISNGIHLKFSTTGGPGSSQALFAESDTIFPNDNTWYCFGISWNSAEFWPNRGATGEYSIIGYLVQVGVPNAPLTTIAWNPYYTGGTINAQAFSTPYMWGGVWNNWSVSAWLNSQGTPSEFYTNNGSAQLYWSVQTDQFTVQMGQPRTMGGFLLHNFVKNTYGPAELGVFCLAPYGETPAGCMRGNHSTYLQSIGGIFQFAVPQGYLGPSDATDDPFVVFQGP